MKDVGPYKAIFFLVFFFPFVSRSRLMSFQRNFKTPPPPPFPNRPPSSSSESRFWAGDIQREQDRISSSEQSVGRWLDQLLGRLLKTKGRREKFPSLTGVAPTLTPSESESAESSGGAG